MSCRKSQPCAYSHVSLMLERTSIDWWLAMFEFEVYFDDSGTDSGTPVAVAACYVAKKTQWDEFVRNWDRVSAEEGFEMFHMAEFVAKPEMGHEPFCHLDNEKKNRVYAKLASIINTRVHKGFAIAVPKKPFDEYIFEEFKQYAENHYIWAAKCVMGLLDIWRQRYSITDPMQYVFESGSLGQHQLESIWDNILKHPGSEKKYGLVKDGVQFQSKKLFKPLQAADILAWQMQNHMRRTVMIGRDSNDIKLIHPGFLTLRNNRPMDLGFYSPKQVQEAFAVTKEFHSKNGLWPWEPEAKQFAKVTLSFGESV
jgi:hypothetical protein